MASSALSIRWRERSRPSALARASETPPLPLLREAASLAASNEPQELRPDQPSLARASHLVCEQTRPGLNVHVLTLPLEFGLGCTDLLLLPPFKSTVAAPLDASEETSRPFPRFFSRNPPRTGVWKVRPALHEASLAWESLNSPGGLIKGRFVLGQKGCSNSTPSSGDLVYRELLEKQPCKEYVQTRLSHRVRCDRPILDVAEP